MSTETSAGSDRTVARIDPESKREIRYVLDHEEYERLVSAGYEPKIVDENVLYDRAHHVISVDAQGRLTMCMSQHFGQITTVYEC